MRYKSNTSGYSVIIALFVMSFLLLLTTGVFRLVLGELLQNRGEESYLKAFAGAESARELALLHIKDQGYGSYDRIDHSVSNRSILLSSNKDDVDLFQIKKDVFISYDLGYRVSSYQGNLGKLEYDIIPLYSNNEHVKDISLEVVEGIGDTLLWNIIGTERGLANFGDFTRTTRGKSRSLNEAGFNDAISVNFSRPSIENFLRQGDDNYLVVFNAGQDRVQYRLQTPEDIYFTLPRTDIITSAQIGKYRQNLKTTLDNTQFLGILRYSIFSPNADNSQ